MARRGRPPRDRERERIQAEVVLDDWRRARNLDLMFTRREDAEQALFPRLMAEIQWLRFRLGDTEEAVDTLDAIVKPRTPPSGDTVT